MFNGPWQLTAAQDALKDDLGVALVPKFFGEGDWAGSHILSISPSAQDHFRRLLPQQGADMAGIRLTALRAGTPAADVIARTTALEK